MTARGMVGEAALGRLSRLRLGPHAALVTVLVAVGVVATLRAPEFLTDDNLIEILRAASTYFIVACPLAMLIIAGGLDFSIGATFSVGAVVATALMTDGVAWPLACALGLAAGAATGYFGGAMAVYLRVPPIIATLAVFFMASGLINVLVKGLLAPLPQGFLRVGQDELLGVPLLVWYAAAVGVLAWTILEKTPFGYELRATGGNRVAANASGINVRRVELTMYTACGAIAALAGILYAARTSAGQPDAGGYVLTLQVLTAVLVGGVSLSGGVGSITGVAFGSLLFAEIDNALGVAGFDPVWSDVFIGAILALAVALDSLRRRRRFINVPAERVARPPSVSRMELERLMSGSDGADRAHVVAAVSTERKRIERSLHDGAQQRLAAMVIWLDVLKARLAEPGPAPVGDVVDRLSGELAGAMDELRELAHGRVSGALADDGLDAALAELAGRAPELITVSGRAGEGIPAEVATAAYFATAEGLTNALRHSQAESIELAVTRSDAQLQVEVRDDGVGGARFASGTGLRGLRDRVTERDGELTLTSPPGAGTVVRIELPLSSSD